MNIITKLVLDSIVYMNHSRLSQFYYLKISYAMSSEIN